MEEQFKNMLLTLFATGIFNTKTTAEWEASDYQLAKGELVFSMDLTDPEDPLTAVVKAKLGQGGLTWLQTPYWQTDIASNYRPIKVLTAADFTAGVYTNGSWAGLTHYQVFQNGTRLKNQITRNPAGGFSLNSGFELFDEELVVIF